MPKQPGDKKIETRIRYILEVIERHDRVSVSRIVEEVARHMGIKLPNKNFRRCIERDIENLENEPAPQRIGCLYFKANGEEISWEERRKYKNIRKECYFRNSKHHIRGFHLLKEHLIQFYSQQGPLPEWSVSDFKLPIKKKHLLFVFNTHKSFIALHIPMDDIPLKLIVGRKVEASLIPGILTEIRKFHHKASLLLLPDPAISRPVLGKRLGHAMFEFNKNPHEIKITDFRSTNATYYQATELRENIEKLKNKKKPFDDEETSLLPLIAFEDEVQNAYEIPVGELEIMTEWVKVEFDIDKYRFDQEFERLKKAGLVNKQGNIIDSEGKEVAEITLPEINLADIEEKTDQINDTLPISVKMGSTTFYIVTLD
jgi:hypothetical protein